MRNFILLVVLSLLQACLYGQSSSATNADIRGQLKKWHKVTLLFDGPQTGEMAEDNPFLNYRLDVTFSPRRARSGQGDHSYTVPGFFAADGDAANSGESSGNKWIVRFAPDRLGEWTYHVSFKKGENIAVGDQAEGRSAGFMDGVSGHFFVKETDKTGRDSRAKGRLNYVGGPYLRFEETGAYFIKVGVDAPENLLAYTDFDATPDVFDLRKNWNPHRKDYMEEAQNYLWQGEKGKNLMGAIHYLASEGLNAFSFLTFNVDGDDRNVFPHLLKVSEQEYKEYADVKENKKAWNTLFYKTRFDVSKLEQWERIFSYAETQGMFLHFKTQETETDHLMDGGELGVETKLYYRELIARFGHHLALNWNLGEENTQSIEEVRKVAEYIQRIDPYQHHRVIHTYPNQDGRYQELIGEQSVLTGASLQLTDRNFRDVHDRVLKWRKKSDAAGRPWAIAVDEPGNAKYALLTDEENPDHDSARENGLWGALMAGGYGVEWYFGYASPHSDLTCQDFRSRDLFWDQNRAALEFFEKEIPFWEMEPSDELTKDSRSWCLAREGEAYVVFIPPGLKTTSMNIPRSGKKYSVQWYNPRKDGVLEKGSIDVVKGDGFVELGMPPYDEEKDWVVLVRRK